MPENPELEGNIDMSLAPALQRDEMDTQVHGSLRLTTSQANRLLELPGVEMLSGLRDTLMIVYFLCLGLRVPELCALQVSDLYVMFNNMPAVHVPPGTGCTERLIPYGDMLWAFEIAQVWLRAAQISEGPVFRSLYKGGNKTRPGSMALRAVQWILDSYPILINGALITVKPLDLRRTYAQRLFASGMDIRAIQQNLGLGDVNAVLEYIGSAEPEDRVPASLYSFDMSKLASWETTERQPEL